MTQREDSGDTYTNLPDLEQHLVYLKMPTRSQTVGTYDPLSEHDASNDSNANQVRMIREQNARLEQIIERLADRETET